MENQIQLIKTLASRASYSTYDVKAEGDPADLVVALAQLFAVTTMLEIEVAAALREAQGLQQEWDYENPDGKFCGNCGAKTSSPF